MFPRPAEKGNVSIILAAHRTQGFRRPMAPFRTARMPAVFLCPRRSVVGNIVAPRPGSRATRVPRRRLLPRTFPLSVFPGQAASHPAFRLLPLRAPLAPRGGQFCCRRILRFSSVVGHRVDAAEAMPPSGSSSAAVSADDGREGGGPIAPPRRRVGRVRSAQPRRGRSMGEGCRAIGTHA